MKGLLDGAVKLVMVQFILSSIKLVPQGLFQKSRESVDELIARKSGVKGREFLASTENVSLVRMPANLALAGYVLVDAFFKMRTDARGKESPVPRFVFASEDNVRPEGEFLKHRETAAKGFEQLCQDMWKTQGYLNPFFQNGEIVEGQFAISLNMADRNPLVDAQGKPILRWQKDERGERIGEAPVPLEPKLFLQIQDDDIDVFNA